MTFEGKRVIISLIRQEMPSDLAEGYPPKAAIYDLGSMPGLVLF
nr:MAG TPA: hypothetical protein [Caudoviricetes sp.]DAU02075.1 MAG TPA: hypothetical protein [Caudoviricetes sp.]